MERDKIIELVVAGVGLAAVFTIKEIKKLMREGKIKKGFKAGRAGVVIDGVFYEGMIVEGA